MKLLINKKKKKLYNDSINHDINTNEGLIRKDDFNSQKEIITTHKGVSFLKLEPDFKELFHNIKRGPQIITLKDAYFISAQLGLMNKFNVLDCGGGSGALTCVFANIVGDKGRVVSVEREARFVKIIKDNVSMFKFKNVEVFEGDLNDYKSRKKFDAANLDVPNPWDYIKQIINLLKNGSALTVYVPNTTQLTVMGEKAKDSNLFLENVYEIIQREWDVYGSVCHPKFKILGHTGFVMVFKKLEGV
ncbi:MAG: methyltransferase domain-containing protein [Nanoarchaeota archaeon]|nr:methyltransferase domain-containing protein [Nanoarchaeota archaeon]